jgi:hypothetical protein
MSLLIGGLARYESGEPWGVPGKLIRELKIPFLDAKSLVERKENKIRGALLSSKVLNKHPTKMAQWIYQSAKTIHGHYDKAEWLWNNNHGILADRLMCRLGELSGMSASKSLILLDVLEADWNIKINKWEDLKLPMTESIERMSIRIGLDRLRFDPRHLPALYEGMRIVSKKMCGKSALCSKCLLNRVCPKFEVR